MTKIDKAWHISTIASLMLDYAGRILKNDSSFYNRKNKVFLNNLINNNLPILNSYDKLKELLSNEEFVNSVDSNSESEKNNLYAVKEFFILMMTIFIVFSTKDIYSINLYLRNIIKKKKLYTEEEVKNILKNGKVML
jgi:hypothetical protein